MDPRFGRCQYFVIVEADTLEFEAIKNPNNAFQTLHKAGSVVVKGASGIVKEAIKNIKKAN